MRGGEDFSCNDLVFEIFNFITMLHFLFLHAGELKSARHCREEAGKVIWVYLGQSAEQRAIATRLLGKPNRLSINTLLQRIAHQEKQAHLDFIAELGLAQREQKKWWASNIAYKCPLTNDFFLLFCYAKVIEQLIMDRAASAPTTCVFVIQDRWLFRFLRLRYRCNLEHAEFFGRASVLPEIAKAMIRGVSVRIYFVMRMVYHKLCSRWVSKKSPSSRIPEAAALACLYSWIEPRCVGNGRTYADAYLGRLDEILHSLDLNVVRLAPLATSASLIRRAVKMADFILMGNYASFFDIFKSAFAVFTMRIPSVFADAAVRALLRREVFLEFSRSAFLENVLHFKVFRRMFAAMPGKRLFVIYPFENQSWERMLCLAAAEFAPRVQPIGHEHASVPLLMLNYFLGAKEAGSAPLPEYVITTCDRTARILQSNGYPLRRVLSGGSLRFNDGKKPDRPRNERNREVKTVLIALSYLPSLSAELLAATLDAFCDSKQGAFRFLVKCHPDTPLSALRADTATWPDYFQTTEEPMAALLSKVDLVIYSSSTVGLEAVSNGVPVVKYLSSCFLDLDILDERENNELPICDDTSLATVAMKILTEDAADAARRISIQQERCLDYFAPVDEKVWAQAVQAQASDKSNVKASV